MKWLGVHVQEENKLSFARAREEGNCMVSGGSVNVWDMFMDVHDDAINTKKLLE